MQYNSTMPSTTRSHRRNQSIRKPIFQPFRYANSKFDTESQMHKVATDYNAEQAVAPNYLPKMNTMNSTSPNSRGGTSAVITVSGVNSKMVSPRNARLEKTAEKFCKLLESTFSNQALPKKRIQSAKS